MKKTVYQVQVEGQIIDVRKSHREYTHAVALIYNHRHTPEGYIKVEEFFNGASYCGSLELAQKQLASVQRDSAKHSARNPHMAINGVIVAVKKI